VGHTGSIRTSSVSTHFGRLLKAIDYRVRGIETPAIAEEGDIEVYATLDGSTVERDPDIVQVPGFLDQPCNGLDRFWKVLENGNVQRPLFNGLYVASRHHSDQP